MHRLRKLTFSSCDLTQTDLRSLSKTRRKRPVPEGWATAEAISAYQPTETSKPLYPGSKVLSVNSSGELALVGGTEVSLGFTR